MFQHACLTRSQRYACQLEYVATHYRHCMLIVVVSDEPEVDGNSVEVFASLAGRHDILWAMVADTPAIGCPRHTTTDTTSRPAISSSGKAISAPGSSPRTGAPS